MILRAIIVKITFLLLLLLPAHLRGQDSAKALFNKGYHYVSVDRDKAIDYLTQCIRQDSTHTNAFFHRGICYFKKGEYKEALTDFNTAFALNGDLAIIHMYKGFAYRNMGQADKALNSFTKYILQNPQDTTAYSYILRGKMKYEQGDFTGAVEDYDMALKLRPLEEKYQYYKFIALYENKQYQQALKAADRLTKINSNFYGYYLYKGNVFSRLQQLDSAIYMYSISIMKNNRNPDSYFYRGRAYHRKGESHKALGDYNTAIELNPADGLYYTERGKCRLEVNDKQGACEDWSEAGSLGYYEDFSKMKKLCSQ